MEINNEGNIRLAEIKGGKEVGEEIEKEKALSILLRAFRDTL